MSRSRQRETVPSAERRVDRATRLRARPETRPETRRRVAEQRGLVHVHPRRIGRNLRSTAGARDAPLHRRVGRHLRRLGCRRSGHFAEHQVAREEPRQVLGVEEARGQLEHAVRTAHLLPVHQLPSGRCNIQRTENVRGAFELLLHCIARNHFGIVDGDLTTPLLCFLTCNNITANTN